MITIRHQMQFFHLRFLSLLLLFLASTAALAEKRVLFIIETSRETKALVAAEEKLVNALLETGLGGLLETNDTYGVWTFDDTLHIGQFPMQIWNPANRQELAARTTNFLKQRPREKSPKIDLIWRPLQNVIRNSPALMTVIVTTGKHPVSGTPFDEEINQYLKAHYREYQRKKTPVVIMLSSTEGEILRYSINPAIGDVRVPVLTVPPKPPQPAVAEKKTPAPEKPAPVQTPPTPPATNNVSALVITREGAKNISTTEADKIQLTKTNQPSGKVTEPAAEKTAETKTPAIKTVAAAPAVQKENNNSQPKTEGNNPPPASPAPTPKPSTEEPPVAATLTPDTKESKAPAPPALEPVPQPKIEVATITPPQPKPESIEPTTPAATAKTAVPGSPKPAPVAEKPETTTIAQEPVQPAAAEKPVPVANTDTQPEPVNAEVSAPAVQPAPLVAQTEVSSNRFSYLIAAVVLLLIAVILAFFIGRMIGNRPRQSLVSDWADRDRLRK